MVAEYFLHLKHSPAIKTGHLIHLAYREIYERGIQVKLALRN